MTFDGLFEHLALREEHAEITARGADDRRDAVLRWYADYSARWSWTAGTTDVVGACGPGSRWCGAPSAVPGVVVDTVAVVMKPLTPRAVLMLTAADRRRTRGYGRTGPGDVLVVAGLLDEQAADIAPFSAVCTAPLHGRERLRVAGTGRRPAGPVLGRTGERHVPIPTLEDFAIYSAAPLGVPTRRALEAALDGWVGHLRVQAPAGVGSGLVMAWAWHGPDPSTWSARADHTLGVLQAVRNALFGHPTS